MKKRFQYRERPPRQSLDATSTGPALRIVGVVALVLGCLLLTIFVIAPRLTAYFKGDALLPWNAAPSPTVYAAATPTPHPIASNTAVRLGEAGLVAADPSFYGDTLLYATGESAARCDRLVTLDLVSGQQTETPLTLANAGVRYPRRNPNYIVYFDAAQTGGGAVMALDRADLDAQPRTVVDVRYGVPRLFLEDKYLLFMERTGEKSYRLNVIDLAANEAVTAALFDGPAYGVSAPSMASGQILYADASQEDASQSVIESLQIETGERWRFEPGTYVHDPKSNGDCWAWITANHSEDSDLYVSVRGGAPQLIARGVADFGITNEAVVYCRDEVIYACLLSDNRSYILSETGARTQLVVAEGNYALWRDITSPQSPAYYWIRLY